MRDHYRMRCADGPMLDVGLAMTITPEEVAKLAAAATPGPFSAEAINGKSFVVDPSGERVAEIVPWSNGVTQKDAAFIAAAHDMAALIARMDEALTAAEALSEKAHRIANFTIGGMLADDAETRAKYPALATAIIETREALAAYRAARENDNG